MAPVSITELQRLRYWQGQTLRSRDFRDQDRMDAIRLLLHNRALHGVYGISIGLAVSVKTSSPLVLTVACGLAYDCQGAPLILREPRDIEAPAQPASLILRQNDELIWLPDDSFDRINGVVLAKVTATGLDKEFRPLLARPIARPRLARGITIRGNTPWERWEIDEPDGRGGFRKKVIGVQTHIDTSASGFTATPNYFATLDAPEWDFEKAEFAPAFFPQVANPSVDGFTFRLLMAETARRRYAATAGFGRVSQVSLAADGRLKIDLEDASMFRKNDVVSLVRPRGDVAIFLDKQSGADLTLTAPLPDEAEATKTVLALGNIPRTANVVSVAPSNPGVFVTFTAPVNIRKNDIVVRLADSAVTQVSGLSQGRLKVAKPFTDWKKEDKLGFALQSGSVEVSSAGPSKIILASSTHPFDDTTTAVHLNERGEPTGGLSTVTNRTGNTIDLAAPISTELLAELKKLSLVRTGLAVTDLQPQSPGSVVTVDSNTSFREGDFVASAADPNAIAIVDKVDKNKKDVTLRTPISLPPGSVLVAANWICATTVDQPATTTPLTITVGRAGAVPVPSFVVARDGDGFAATAASVQSAAGAAVTLRTPLPDLNRLDTLAVGVFPKIATVVVEEPTLVRITEAGALDPGDLVVRLGNTSNPTVIARVDSASGATAVLRPAYGDLQPGDRLGVIHFRDTALLKSISTTDPKKITIDRDIDLRDGDFVSMLTHYHDNSAIGFVQDLQSNSLTLYPLPFAGDGIVSRDWIDGGILGPAAVSPTLTSTSGLQPLVRMESVDGMDASRPAVAYGYDLLTGQFLTANVLPFLIDPTARRIYVWPLDAASPRRYRPETLAIITTFNADFAAAFATFAQKQNLAVTWIGCQDEFPRPTACPQSTNPEKPTCL